MYSLKYRITIPNCKRFSKINVAVSEQHQARDHTGRLQRMFGHALQSQFSENSGEFSENSSIGTKGYRCYSICQHPYRYRVFARWHLKSSILTLQQVGLVSEKISLGERRPFWTAADWYLRDGYLQGTWAPLSEKEKNKDYKTWTRYRVYHRICRKLIFSFFQI